MTSVAGKSSCPNFWIDGKWWTELGEQGTLDAQQKQYSIHLTSLNLPKKNRNCMGEGEFQSQRTHGCHLEGYGNKHQWHCLGSRLVSQSEWRLSCNLASDWLLQQCTIKIPYSLSILSQQEKWDTFKKSQTLLPVASSNRRWFTIEQGEGGQGKDLLIFYYRKSSAGKEGCCGWLILKDIIGLSQDIFQIAGSS